MSSDVKASDLAGYAGKVVVIQQDIDPALNDGDSFREVQGRCIVGNETGVVLQLRNGTTEMFMLEVLLDIEEVTKVRVERLVKRWIDVIPAGSARQHLLDRHGMPMEVARSLSPDEALTLHELADHNKLGHGHGNKPPGRPGRPRMVHREVKSS